MTDLTDWETLGDVDRRDPDQGNPKVPRKESMMDNWKSALEKAGRVVVYTLTGTGLVEALSEITNGAVLDGIHTLETLAVSAVGAGIAVIHQALKPDGS